MKRFFEIGQVWFAGMVWFAGLVVFAAGVSARAQGKREVVVRTAEEFVEALGADRTIVIDSRKPLDLTPVVERFLENGGARYDYYDVADGNAVGLGWYDNFDGPGLSVTGFDNLTIKGRGGATLVSEPRYANVLLFERCDNLRLENVVMGHTMDGYCEAGVVELRGCKNVRIEGCNLYGCGTEAMIVLRCLNVDVENTEMHHCTYHTMHVKGSAHVRFKGCYVHDNREFEQIDVRDSRDVWFEDCRFLNLQGAFFTGDTAVPFYGCTFERCRNDEAGDLAVFYPKRVYTGRTWRRWVQITGKGVNMRMGPSMEAGKQGGTLVKGEFAPLLEETDGWVRIFTPGHLYGYAWVSKKYAPEVPASAVPEYVRQRCAHDLLAACGDDVVSENPGLSLQGEIRNGARKFFFYAMAGERQLNGIVCNMMEAEGKPDTYYFSGKDRYNGGDELYDGTIRFEELKDGRIKVKIDQEIPEGEDIYRLPKELTLRPLTRDEVEARRDEIDRQKLEGMMDRIVGTWSEQWVDREGDGVSFNFHPFSKESQWGHVYIGNLQYDDRHEIIRHYDYSVPDKDHITFRIETACARETDSKVTFKMAYNYRTRLMTMEVEKMELSHEGAGCMFLLDTDRKRWTLEPAFDGKME